MKKLLSSHDFPPTAISARATQPTVRFFFTRLLLLPFLGLSVMGLNATELPVVPASEAGLNKAKLAEVDKFMERSVADKKIAGGIVMVSRNGQIGFFHTYGQMDLEARKPMRPDTI